VDISAANLNDHLMFQDMIEGLAPVRQPVGRPRKRPLKLHGDKGYDYPVCRELCRARNITARIARKGIESSTRLGQYRYVIERCLEWTTRFRPRVIACSEDGRLSWGFRSGWPMWRLSARVRSRR
jgi:hypothetical protein